MRLYAIILITIVCIIISFCVGDSGVGTSDATTEILSDPINKCESMIPSQQPRNVTHETNPYPSPPSGYTAVIGWVNATIGTGGAAGSVKVNNLKLWQKVNGTSTLVASKIVCSTCTDPNDRVWGYSLHKDQWQDPLAWWGKSNEGTKFFIDGESVIIPVSNIPDDVYHFWHAVWPRPTAISQRATYYITADVLVEGDAMVQIGIDYCPTTTTGNSLEAAVSNWYCAATNVQTIKAGAY